MMTISDIFAWFAGGSHRYHDLYHCMRGDVFWVALTVALDLAVAVGYVLIALHWRSNERRLPESPAKSALRDIKLIFIFCGICGYVFIPIKMYWPAWRLYDMFMIILVIVTYKYALGARTLKVVYNELGRTAKLSEELRESRAESDRKTFFLNAISHDMRTPLNGLLLQTEVAEISMEADDREALHECFYQMKASVRAAADLLDRLLEYGQTGFQEEQQLVPVDVLALLEETVGHFQVQALAKGLSLHLDPLPPLVIESDRLKLERILFNLVSNAIKFTDDGNIRLTAEASPELIIISVTDTGEGIAEENLGRLFEEFFQVHNRERDRDKGYGLGLAIARRLADQLGGKISVESRLGRGSRFRLTLPRSRKLDCRTAGGLGIGPSIGLEPSPATAPAR